MQQYDQLIEENLQFKKAVLASKAVIDKKINELETQTQINDDLKQQLAHTRQDNQELQNRVRQLAHEKKQIEQQFDTTIKNSKLLIEQKQREIEEIQSKLVPTFESDMVRIKIINELEVPHRQQMEQKLNEIERLNENVYQLKRTLDLNQIKIETITTENQKQLKLLQQQHQLQVDDLNYQIIELSKIIEDNKDKELIKRLRKELDEFKSRFQQTDLENEELRGERDRIREEKNEMMVKYSRQIDSERTDKRQYKSEADKLNVRVRFLEDEFRKEKMRREQLIADFEILKAEKEGLLPEIRKKDDTIHYLQRKITSFEEDSLENEQKQQEKMTRLYHDEHDKYLQERNKAVTLSKDLDNLKKRFSDLTDDYKILKDRYMKENQDNRDNIKSNNEELDKLKKTVAQQHKDIGDLERTNQLREEQINDLQSENDNIKRRNRELYHRIQLFENQPLPVPHSDNYETKPQKQQKEVVQNNEREVENKPPPKQESENKVEKQSLQLVTEENRTLIKKNKKLQQKIQQANDRILELQMKNKVYEKQLGEIQRYPSNQSFQQNTVPVQSSFQNSDPKPSIIHNQSPFRTNQQQTPKPQQQYNPQQYSDPHDDELLNKVMMLTSAANRQMW